MILTNLFNKKQPLFSLCFLFFLQLSISSCTRLLPEAYTVSPHQGNTVTREQLDKIKLGMSKTVVNKIMGTPVIADPFHAQRWDYIFRYTPKNGFDRKSHIILYFKDSQLIKIDKEKYIEP